MYDKNKEMSNKLFNFINKNISYETDQDVLKRIKLNKKTKVIQDFVKKKIVAIKEKKSIAVNKIIKYIKSNPKLIVTETKDALRGKVKSISIKPKILAGFITARDLPFLIFQSYKKVLTQIDYKNVRVSCTVNAKMVDDGSDFWAATDQHQKKFFKNVFHEIIAKIEAGLEEYDEIDLSTLEIIYKFIDIPTGGTGTTSREKSSLSKRKSWVAIKNDDNNCFWYALTVQIYRNHRCYEEIRKGRPIRKIGKRTM